MLILQRKIGQSIIINQEINVKILSINKKCVRLGIEAPKDISIWRDDMNNIPNKSEKQSKTQTNKTQKDNL